MTTTMTPTPPPTSDPDDPTAAPAEPTATTPGASEQAATPTLSARPTLPLAVALSRQQLVEEGIWDGQDPNWTGW